MRRAFAGVAAVFATLAFAVPAHGARLVTLVTHSRYVDPAKVDFNLPQGTPPALRADVLLPTGYDGRRRYPVLYLLHGHGDAYNSWMDPKDGDVAHVAKGFGGVIVMPEGDRGWYTNWWRGGARSPGWERYHLDELIPLIERKFRIRRGRRWRAIAGLSMGGEGAMYYASQRPGYFGSAASFSGVLSIQRPEWPMGFDTQGEKHVDVYGDPDAQRFYWTGHNPTALVRNLRRTRLFIAVGDGVPAPGDGVNYFGSLAEADLRMHAQDFVNAARSVGDDVTYDPRQGIHAWRYWRQHLTDALKWGFFRPVIAHTTRWTYTTVAKHSRAWGFRFDFKHVPRVVETFRRSGAVLSGEGAGTVVIRGIGIRLPMKLPFSTRLPRRQYERTTGAR